MVQLMKSAEFELGGDNEKAPPPVKVEFVEDPLEEEHGSLPKRSRTSSGLDQGFMILSIGFMECGESVVDWLLDINRASGVVESAPLLAHYRLNYESGSTPARGCWSRIRGIIGTMVRVPMHFLTSHLPNTIHWMSRALLVCDSGSALLLLDLIQMKLSQEPLPDDGPSTLKVVLGRHPLFFRETNPQPRKHTLWQATSDFTDGQASVHRLHFLECPQGLLAKHFEKLIQCDMRLGFLSREPEVILDSPLFDTRPSVFEDLEESKGIVYDGMESDKISMVAAAHRSPVMESSSSKDGHQDLLSMTSDTSRDIQSPFSGSGSSGGVGMKARNWDQIKVPGLHPSMSMSDL
ncbi:hypothetical protein MLD38_014930 [Melastoma candidum]|uniref:Uncharacterized protein n=1 Tax=Melastoma candidum TaxID=119954 RepID=A0ACB9REZ4_9MYRT|nr:hypothetical protein MLD38_014930 [Melastoma candidum]